MIHCLLVDICSDDMMHYYTCISNILQNLNNIVKNNINIWFLFFDFRHSYFHSFYRVSMREVVIRVTHIPRQRCAKVLLTMILPVCFYSATPSADVIMEWDLHFMMTLFPAPGNSAISTTPLPQAKEL